MTFLLLNWVVVSQAVSDKEEDGEEAEVNGEGGVGGVVVRME